MKLQTATNLKVVQNKVIEHFDSFFNTVLCPAENIEKIAKEGKEQENNNTAIDPLTLVDKIAEKKEAALDDIKSIQSQPSFDMALSLMQKKYSIINRNGKVYILSEDHRNGLLFTDVESFRTYHKYLCLVVPVVNTTKVEKRYLATAFLEHPDTKRLDGIIFDPKFPSGVCGKYYNIWKGWTYEPVKGKVDLFLKLVDVNFNYNKELSEYFLNYMAHAIQKPEKMPMTSIVIKGKQGTGKGTLIVDTVLKLNRNSKHIEDINMLIGEFNGHMNDAFFVCADEINFGGNIKEANRLKTFITEKERTINDKMKTAYKVDAFTRSFILSNNDYVVNVESGDRRYVIAECSDELKGNFKWFDDYQKYLVNGGFNHIMHFLLNIDIKLFNPLEIPNTESKTELQIKSSDLSTRFLIDLLNGDVSYAEGVIDNNKVSRTAFYNQFVDYVKKYSPKSYIPTSTEFGKIVNKAYDFEQDKPEWRTNWKHAKNGYYYLMPREVVQMERLAKNLFKIDGDKINSIFFQYETLKQQQNKG